VFKPGTFFKNLVSYMLKCDSMLDSHYKESYVLTEHQRILIIELYGYCIVIDRYIKGLIGNKKIDEVDLNKVSVSKAEFARLSEMVKITMQIVLEMEDTGLSLQEI
jgi:hypothetical protein